MTDRLADLDKNLARLLRRAMKANAVEYEKLGTQIWRVLREEERLSNCPRRAVHVQRDEQGNPKPEASLIK